MFVCQEGLNSVSASDITTNYVNTTSNKEKELIAHQDNRLILFRVSYQLLSTQNSTLRLYFESLSMKNSFGTFEWSGPRCTDTNAVRGIT